MIVDEPEEVEEDFDTVVKNKKIGKYNKVINMPDECIDNDETNLTKTNRRDQIQMLKSGRMKKCIECKEIKLVHGFKEQNQICRKCDDLFNSIRENE